jgi:hypothetical protein
MDIDDHIHRSIARRKEEEEAKRRLTDIRAAKGQQALRELYAAITALAGSLQAHEHQVYTGKGVRRLGQSRFTTHLREWSIRETSGSRDWPGSRLYCFRGRESPGEDIRELGFFSASPNFVGVYLRDWDLSIDETLLDNLADREVLEALQRTVGRQLGNEADKYYSTWQWDRDGNWLSGLKHIRSRNTRRRAEDLIRRFYAACGSD